MARTDFDTVSKGGGAIPGKLVSAASTNATVIKPSAGTLFSITASNVNAAVRYLKLYDKATAPDENDTPVQVYAMQGGATGPSFENPIPATGLRFTAGIAFRTTTEATDAGTTGVSASEHVISYSYA